MTKRSEAEINWALALGKVLRDIRDKRHLSQEKFGNLLGLHRTHIGFIERGEKTVKSYTLYEITDALDLPPGELEVRVAKVYKAHNNTKHRPNEKRPNTSH